MLKDTKGEKSTTMTVFIIGFIVVCIKLLASGLTIGGYQMSPFSGVDFSAAMSSLAFLYLGRRSKFIKEKENKDEDI